MLSLGRHRAVCCLRNQNKRAFLAAKPWRRGMKEVACAPPLDDVVELRRQQAQRTLLVEVAGPSSAAELCRVCGQHGRVKELIHYSVPVSGGASQKEMILVEFSSAPEVQEALRHSIHPPFKDCPPSHSPMVWLSAGKGGTSPSQDDAVTPSLTLTPTVTESKMLMGLSECSSISEQIQALYDGQKLTELGWRLRFFTCRQLEASLSGLFPNAAVLPFGSSVNSFGHRDSDLDMTLELGGNGHSQQDSAGRLVFQTKSSSSAVNPRLTLQRRMEVVADLVAHFLPGCSQVRRILSARVPIIKYRQELTAIDCDLTMANRSGYHMSRMLHLYGTADSRVIPLVGAVRRWAKCRDLTSSNPGRWVTNFSLTLMVLTYLMNTSPPVLLPLSALKVTPGTDEETNEAMFIVPPESAAAAAAAAARNKESLESLFLGFFEFFDNFDFRERGMSIVNGRDFVKPVHCALYIQNPLDRDLNVSRNVILEEVERLRTELTHARFLMEGSTEETWGAQQLWVRTGSAAQRSRDITAGIDWRSVFSSTENTPKPTPSKPVKSTPVTEGNKKGIYELPKLVFSLKQKAQQKRNQPNRHIRKGKMPR